MHRRERGPCMGGSPEPATRFGEPHDAGRHTARRWVTGRTRQEARVGASCAVLTSGYMAADLVETQRSSSMQRGRSSVSLSDLLHVGLLQPGQELRFRKNAAKGAQVSGDGT